MYISPGRQEEDQKINPHLEINNLFWEIWLLVAVQMAAKLIIGIT